MKQQPKDKQHNKSYDRQKAAEEDLQREAAAAEDVADEPSTEAAASNAGPGGVADPAEQQDLRIVDEGAVGTGKGLDEAELGRKKPLDGKPWDGDPDEDYGTE